MPVRLLIVDDDETHRRSLAEAFDRPGYEVSNLPDGRQAVERVRREDVDVVLLDVLMPGLNGLETLVQIRELRPLTEVIFLTGHADVQTAVEAIAKGAFDYVAKPVDLPELMGKVEAACANRQFQQRLAAAE